MKNNKHDNQYFQNEYNKNGIEIFNFYILEECDEKDLKIKETENIKKFNSKDKRFGYNLTDGGDGLIGIIRTWGDKISQSKLGVVFSQEHIENLKTSHLGYTPTMEQKIKLQNSLTGKKKSKNSSSKYVGVSKRGNSWRATIMINHKQELLGTFKIEEEAARAYDKKCWELYHDLNKLNFSENYK